jgi:ankyrin repeat protein
MTTRQFLGCAAILLCTAALPAIAAGKSDVADAAMQGDLAAVRTLIVKKADVNAPQVDGATALHWAVHLDNAEMVEALIKAGANVKAANRDGATPLSIAALYGNPRVVEALLKGGADAKARGANGETMLMIAARNGNPAVIKLFAAAGADVNAKETVRGTTALMWAAEQRHPAAVKALLELGADPSAKSGGAGLPRNYMAQRVNTRAVEEAQKRRERAKAAGRTYEEQIEWENANNAPGAAGEATRRVGRSSLGRFWRRPRAPAPRHRPQERQRPRHRQQRPQRRRQPQVPAVRLPRAVAAAAADVKVGRADRAGGPRRVPERQPRRPDNPDQDDTEVVVAGLVGSGGGGLTALIFAAREGDLESAKALVDAGAKVNQTSEYGWTPLLTAVNNRNYQLALYLLDHGADPNLANKGGWTPLYIATDNRNIEGGDYPVPKPDIDHLVIIRALLDKGANVNAVVKENTLTRTIFTMQWFFESGAERVRARRAVERHGADEAACSSAAPTRRSGPTMATPH